MPEYADIYGLSETRTQGEIQRFLDRFLPSRIESADEYEVPQYSNSPHTVFQSADQLITYCCENPTQVHAIYWRSDSVPRHGEVFFLSDGNLIFGISTPSEDHVSVDTTARDLCSFLSSCDVFVTYEDVPPQSALAFRSVLRGLKDDPSESERQNRTHKQIWFGL